MFGRMTSQGTIAVFEDDGGRATRMEGWILYPVGSSLSAEYEHAEGIVLTVADAERIGLPIEP